ncbi:MAG TPA: hypothetical protein VF090_01175 [Methyloceanibacter sp.]
MSRTPLPASTRSRDADHELAFANIKKAAQYYGVDVKENSWRELGRR